MPGNGDFFAEWGEASAEMHPLWTIWGKRPEYAEKPSGLQRQDPIRIIIIKNIIFLSEWFVDAIINIVFQMDKRIT